jgi:1-acyl-sn-glycerol-3-phosphate acyltransferase
MKGKKPAPPKKKAASASSAPPKKTAQRAPGKTSTRKERPVPRTLAGMGREMPRPASPPPIDPRLEDTVVIDTLPHSSRPVRVPSSDSIDAVTMELPAVVAVNEEPPPFSRRAAIIAESTKQLEDEDIDDIEDIEDIETTIAFPRKDPSIAAPPPAVVAQIRELEAQLDRLIDEASRRDVSALVPESEEDLEHADTDADGGKKSFEDDLEITRDALPESLRAVVEQREQRSAPNIPVAPPSEATVFDTARELLSSDFYLRKWGRMAMRGRSEEVDDFGFDPIYEQKFRTVLEFLYSKYFRVETSGIERVPSHGRCLLVANHSGTVPLDGVMLKTAVKLEHPAGRDVRWLTEDFIYHMPYLGSIMNRLGAVRACQENAERLLGKEQLVAVFPEGVKGIGKLFSERYRLQRFGRGGFIKLCLRTQTPIVPVAVVGAEETNPLLFRFEYLSKAIGVPYVPVTPTFPLLGPLGLLPAPTKWTIEFGEPLDFSGHGVDAADDELLVGRLAERVRATIQSMLDRKVGARKSVFFG